MSEMSTVRAACTTNDARAKEDSAPTYAHVYLPYLVPASNAPAVHHRPVLFVLFDYGGKVVAWSAGILS